MKTSGGNPYAQVWDSEGERIVDVECKSDFEVALLEQLSRLAGAVERIARSK